MSRPEPFINHRPHLACVLLASSAPHLLCQHSPFPLPTYFDQVSVLEQSSLHFVRCFKPNDKKVPDLCETEVVARQLHTSGVLDALRVARTGFPDRQPFADFCGTFAALYKGDRDVFDAKPEKERCVLLLKQLEVPADKYRVGKERIFFASGMLSLLREKRVALMASVAILLQARRHAALLLPPPPPPPRARPTSPNSCS
eukprot:6205459-Pleurochrysis_carterae.AAC.5